MAIYFWQNILSPHQAPYIRALADIADTEVTLFAQERVPEWRRDIGWSEPDFGKTIVKVGPDASMISAVMRRTSTEDTHFFSGMRAYPTVWQAFRTAVQSPARVGLISEPSDWRGIKGAARILRARTDRTRYAQRIDLIMAIGHLAVRWFRIVGYADHLLFPFAYTSETPQCSERSQASRSDGKFRLLFIGQCIHRKGVDLLLDALGPLCSHPWELIIVGDGDERLALEKQSEKLGLRGRVVFTGALANAAAMELLETSDLLVLPSRWDGWGAVVNEALMRGVPVVCSSTCGAADLLRERFRGEVFAADSATALRDALVRRVGAGGASQDQRTAIRLWSQAISGPRVASYARAVIAAVRSKAPSPVAPWLTTDKPTGVA